MRVIDADEAEKALGEAPLLWHLPDEYMDEYELGRLKQWEQDIEAITSLPTIEAEPVRRARDIYQQVKGHCEFKCSLCGVELGEVRGGEHDYGLDGGYFKYCPNCGAKMDGGQE